MIILSPVISFNFLGQFHFILVSESLIHSTKKPVQIGKQSKHAGGLWEELCVDQRKARSCHKYDVNAARGEREIIRASFNLQCTLGKDELNLAVAAGSWLPSGKVGTRYNNETVATNNWNTIVRNLDRNDESNRDSNWSRNDNRRALGN